MHRLLFDIKNMPVLLQSNLPANDSQTAIRLPEELGTGFHPGTVAASKPIPRPCSPSPAEEDIQDAGNVAMTLVVKNSHEFLMIL
jgi:hypothetical protein